MPNSLITPSMAPCAMHLPSGNIIQAATLYEWTCHICGLVGMDAVTTQKCANCIHYRCPECRVEKIEIDD